MNRLKRIVIVFYCLALAYCCIWIPWSVTLGGTPQRKITTVTYSLVWAAPTDGYEPAPDMRLIFLRIVAITAVGAASFILVGLAAKSATRN